MHTKVLSWLAIAVSLFVLAFWSSAQSFQLELNLVVSAGALAVLIRAFQARKYYWAVGFIAIFVLFNPAIAIFRLSGTFGYALVISSMTIFALSLISLRLPPLLSIPSITGRTPGSRSL